MSNYKKPYEPAISTRAAPVMGMRDSLPRNFSRQANVIPPPEMFPPPPPSAPPSKFPKRRPISVYSSDTTPHAKGDRERILRPSASMPVDEDDKQTDRSFLAMSTRNITNFITSPRGTMFKTKQNEAETTPSPNRDSLHQRLETPIITHESVYAEPDLMKRYSASKARNINAENIIDIEKGQSELKVVASVSGDSSKDDISEEDVYIVGDDPGSKVMFDGSGKVGSKPPNANRSSIFYRAISLVRGGDSEAMNRKSGLPIKSSFSGSGSDLQSKRMGRPSFTGSQLEGSVSDYQDDVQGRKVAFLKDASKSTSHNRGLSFTSSFIIGKSASRSQMADEEPQLISGGLEETLKSMGIHNRQEGDMDFECALLLVMLQRPPPKSVSSGTAAGTGTGAASVTESSTGGYTYDAALRANEEALEKLGLELGDDNPEVIQRKAATADLYKGLGMPHAAEILLRQVIESQKHILDPKDAELCSSKNDLVSKVVKVISIIRFHTFIDIANVI